MSSNSISTTLSAFATDVCNGLSARQKSLSSKYFYDEKGDALFQQIMAMPEYYLTDAEFEVFRNHKKQIINLWKDKGAFELIELGAGDGSKTKVLLEELIQQQVDFRYRPIDISGNILDTLTADLTATWPKLKIDPVQGDYFKALAKIPHESGVRKVVLFLGSNIGNFSRTAARDFLEKLNSLLYPGDLVFIGLDLKKDPQTILDAYNDPAGITRDFNLNLLHRINRELDADFQVKEFKHWETYNPVTGETKSYLISKKEQEVYIGTLDQNFRFAAWEPIEVELSLKYSLEEIKALAKESGFNVKQNFQDEREYFVDTLWEVAK